MKLIRLQKIIADSGICSRRKAEVLIEQGKVKLNGKEVTQLGTKADPFNDEISVSGKILNQKETTVYYLFYKPKNIVSTLSDPQKRPTVLDFLKKIPQRVYPVGRLDFQSEGLMILTNDGELTQKISHPSGLIRKTYHIQVNETLSAADIKKLKAGATVEGKNVVPLAVTRMDRHSEPPIGVEGRLREESKWLEFILAEGRKREIRVLCENAGLTIRRLIRVAIGGIRILDLHPGQLKEVTRNFIERKLLSKSL